MAPTPGTLSAFAQKLYSQVYWFGVKNDTWYLVFNTAIAVIVLDWRLCTVECLSSSKDWVMPQNQQATPTKKKNGKKNKQQQRSCCCLCLARRFFRFRNQGLLEGHAPCSFSFIITAVQGGKRRGLRVIDAVAYSVIRTHDENPQKRYPSMFRQHIPRVLR